MANRTLGGADVNSGTASSNNVIAFPIHRVRREEVQEELSSYIDAPLMERMLEAIYEGMASRQMVL